MATVPHSKAEVQEILKGIWADRLETFLGEVFLDFLADHTDATHIPFGQFISLARERKIEDVNVVLNVISCLTGARLNLLDTAFEYIDGDVVEQLEINQVKAAKNANINPLTGEVEENISQRIFMFFIPSELAKQALVIK
ncbi:hypothetical protein [Herbaspirillum lusitanum]|uniref:hypothetical protein n=1 Tax=Herbaspirillum lusitanum TaxID=213312 RepID=UPI0003699F73|nr:hypothetical protein [Herbaspirillum lusitanum]